MENASKALLIAGAILIAILLISVAVLIINSTSSMSDRVSKQSSTMDTQSFNANLLSYTGDNLTIATVKELLTTIIAINGSDPDNYVMVDFFPTKSAEHASRAHIYKADALSLLLKTISQNDKNYKYQIFVTPDCNHYGLTNSYRPNGYIGSMSIRRMK